MKSSSRIILYCSLLHSKWCQKSKSNKCLLGVFSQVNHGTSAPAKGALPGGGNHTSKTFSSSLDYSQDGAVVIANRIIPPTDVLLSTVGLIQCDVMSHVGMNKALLRIMTLQLPSD